MDLRGLQSVSLHPEVPTTYTLTATGPDGDRVTAQAQVSVAPFAWVPGSVAAADRILSAGATGSFDEHLREIGNVLYDASGAHPYRLLYSAHQGAYQQDQVFVGSAWSDDGRTWTKAGQLIARSLEDPYVLKAGGTYYLYAEDKAEVPFRSIRRYHSSDFLTWTDDGTVLDVGPDGSWESLDVSSPVVWVEGGTWYLMYEGRARAGTDFQGGAIGLATSADGLSWTKSPGNPVVIANHPSFFPGRTPDVPWAISVVTDDLVKVGDRYFLSYHAYQSGPKQWSSGLAVSTDLKAWTDYSAGPVTYAPALGLPEGTLMLMPTGRTDAVFNDDQGIYRSR